MDEGAAGVGDFPVVPPSLVGERRVGPPGADACPASPARVHQALAM